MSISDQPVNKQPSQLLRLLGTSGPDAPNRLTDFITAQVDLLPWWAQGLLQARTGAVAPGVAALGFLNFFVVPADQWWLITHMVAEVPVAAAHTCQVLCCIDDNKLGGQNMALGTMSGPGTALSQGMAVGVGPWPQWYLVAPGDRLGVQLAINTGAAPGAITVSVKYLAFAA